MAINWPLVTRDETLTCDFTLGSSSKQPEEVPMPPKSPNRTLTTTPKPRITMTATIMIRKIRRRRLPVRILTVALGDRRMQRVSARPVFSTPNSRRKNASSPTSADSSMICGNTLKSISAKILQLSTVYVQSGMLGANATRGGNVVLLVRT